MGKSRKRKFDNKEDNNEFDLSKKHLKTGHIRSMEKRLIVVLEGAQLETVKVILFLINLIKLESSLMSFLFKITLSINRRRLPSLC